MQQVCLWISLYRCIQYGLYSKHLKHGFLPLLVSRIAISAMALVNTTLPDTELRVTENSSVFSTTSSELVWMVILFSDSLGAKVTLTPKMLMKSASESDINTHLKLKSMFYSEYTMLNVHFKKLTACSSLFRRDWNRNWVLCSADFLYYQLNRATLSHSIGCGIKLNGDFS